MHYLAFYSLGLAFVLMVFSSCYVIYHLLFESKLEPGLSRLTEWVQKISFLLIGLSSAILVYALATKDFSFAYVRDYTDKFLPLFYALTAFWAGQEGSFLFWLLAISLFGIVFLFSKTYAQLTDREKSMFWVSFFFVQSFFLLLLITYSNPFLKLVPAPLNGKGLNPLLQNVGMIFHPPLLFLGYAGFTVPACLSLVFWLEGKFDLWVERVRGFALLSWVFLSIGILLGCWWSYLELGWGGYWAWDPVENASLIPWLLASSFLHVLLLTRQRKTLLKFSFFLLQLTLLSCFFATLLVRGNLVESLHAFSSGNLTWPLLLFILAYGLILVFSLLVKVPSKPLDELWTKSGLILLTSWLFILAALIIVFATFWPVLSKLWTQNTVGLTASFYNRVCLPVFVGISIFLPFCFVLDWQGRIKEKLAFGSGAIVFALTNLCMWFFGYKNLLAMLAVSTSASALVILIVLIFKHKLYKNVKLMGRYGLHVGMALIILGIGFSGPFQQNWEFILTKGKVVQVDGFKIKYLELKEKKRPGIDIFEGVFEVWKNGQKIGVLRPQKRAYANFDQSFVEVDTYPSLGTEVYISLLGFDDQKNVSVKISLHPGVNWIWIGGIIITMFGLLACFDSKNRKQAA